MRQEKEQDRMDDCPYTRSVADVVLQKRDLCTLLLLSCLLCVPYGVPIELRRQ